MFQGKTIATVGFCLGLVLLAVAAGPARAAITSMTPSGNSTLTGASQPFSWTGTDVLEYWMYVGRSVGAKDIYNSGSLGTANATTVTGLPTNGSTVYVRLWNREAAGWLFTDYTYTAFTDGGGGGSAGNSTLRWDRILDATNGDAEGCNSDRFKCIFGGEAVVDLETGLVWQRQLLTIGGPEPHPLFPINWIGAIKYCLNTSVGGQVGWHLPMLEQLASLVDRSNSNPALPTGHPFTRVQSDRFYLSATTDASNPANAWGVSFGTGNVGIAEKDTDQLTAWCVRGGQSFDGNTHNTLH